MKTSWVGALTVGVLLVTSMAAAAYYNVTGPVEVLVPRGVRGAIITLAFAPDSTTSREWLSGLLISDLSLESPMIIAAWVKALLGGDPVEIGYAAFVMDANGNGLPTPLMTSTGHGVDAPDYFRLQ